MNFIILHGLDGSSRSHWIPWLKAQLESKGHSVWTPNLPHAERPSVRIWTPFIMRGSPFAFDQNLVIIGWSAGAAETLHMLGKLDKPIHGAIIISAFMDNTGWDALSGMFDEDFDFQKIQQNGGQIIFMHGSDDPNCPLEGAKYLADRTAAEIKIFDGAGHFSTNRDSRYKELPEIMPIIEELASV